MKLKRRPIIIGHRGAAAHFPENTLPSFKAAFQQGAKMIEFDIQSSSEGIPTVIHDATLKRTTNGSGKIKSYPVNKLKELDAGRGFKIPTFEDLLKAFPGKRLMVEIKDTHPNITRRVIGMIKKYKRESLCLVGSLDHKIAKQLEKEFPKTERFLSLTEVLTLRRFFNTHKIPEKKWSGKVASMPIRYRGISLDQKSWIAFLHKAGLKAYYWTINDPRKAKALLNVGADGIITDSPKRLKGI